MDNHESELIRKFKDGDKDAADQLIGQFYDRVVRAAKKRLDGVRVRATSEEDIAASVFESLWQRANENRFNDDELASSNDLWKLLSTMVRFKAIDHIRNEKRDKRGGDNLRGESIFIKADDMQSRNGIAEYAVDPNSVTAVAGFREQHQVLMDSLDDEILQEVATMRLEGHTVKDIAAHFSKSDRWVKRKLALIRAIWEKTIDESG